MISPFGSSKYFLCSATKPFAWLGDPWGGGQGQGECQEEEEEEYEEEEEIVTIVHFNYIDIR